jgi:hypothetical protein
MRSKVNILVIMLLLLQGRVSNLLAGEIQNKIRDFYVSPSGSDDNSGTKENPFATLAKARDKVRDWNKKSNGEDIIVWLSGGSYILSETLVFGLDDSAKPGQMITYSALPDETPVICSDVPITGWKKLGNMPKGLPKVAKGKIWAASVPESVHSFKTLYNHEKMLPRAQTKPIAHLRPCGDYSGPDSLYKTLPFKKETVATLFNPLHAEISVIPTANWTMNILPVDSVNVNKGMAYLGASASYVLTATHNTDGNPWWETIWVDNTFAGLDTVGKWVHDEENKLLYYWPLNNEKPGSDIVAPGLVELVRVEGSIDYDGPTDVPVRGLSFLGITFTHGDRFEMGGHTLLTMQHDRDLIDAPTALLRFRGAENCRIENCTFKNSGGTAIRLDLHVQQVKVVNNEIFDIGANGILLCGYGYGTKDVNRDNVIANNHIHNIGRLYWQGLGIWAWQSGHNLIGNNTIHNVPYTAISVTCGLSWTPGSSQVRWHEVGLFTGKEPWEERERFIHGRENIIEHNDIHHVMEKLLDGDGIYISCAGKGNIIRGNFVHDSPNFRFSGEAIRCDEDQHETLIENNIVFRFGLLGTGICSKGRNHIINNIVACPPTKVRRGLISLMPHVFRAAAGSRILRNIFYATRSDQPLVFEYLLNDIINTIEMDNNIYYNPSMVKTIDKYLEGARKNGCETKSIQADPLFKDIENGDFTLLPESPAIKLGFSPFKLKAGIDKNVKF